MRIAAVDASTQCIPFRNGPFRACEPIQLVLKADRVSGREYCVCAGSGDPERRVAARVPNTRGQAEMHLEGRQFAASVALVVH